MVARFLGVRSAFSSEEVDAGSADNERTEARHSFSQSAIRATGAEAGPHRASSTELAAAGVAINRLKQSATILMDLLNAPGTGSKDSN
jgi:hypothetical protein